jgi:hypothetical protein
VLGNLVHRRVLLLPALQVSPADSFDFLVRRRREKLESDETWLNNMLKLLAEKGLMLRLEMPVLLPLPADELSSDEPLEEG